MASSACSSLIRTLRSFCTNSRISLTQKTVLPYFVRCISSSSTGGLFLPLTLTMSANKRLVWVDLEMTGLDVDHDHILEMACIITDGDLKLVAEGPEVIIHQPDSLLDEMNAWCKEHHGKSGLTAACKASTTSLAEAEDIMLSFVKLHISPGVCPLAGNTVHMDKRFLDKYMPNFMSHLHYRIVDVSSIKELCKRWYPDCRPPVKRFNHRAMEDIRQSIEELRFYRQNIFKSQKR